MYVCVCVGSRMFTEYKCSTRISPRGEEVYYKRWGSFNCVIYKGKLKVIDDLCPSASTLELSFMFVLVQLNLYYQQ